MKQVGLAGFIICTFTNGAIEFLTGRWDSFLSMLLKGLEVPMGPLNNFHIIQGTAVTDWIALGIFLIGCAWLFISILNKQPLTAGGEP
jgi:hypothetical protein